VPGRIVRNVVSPDYLPYLADASRNTGTGVVIAPGGGFVMLSYDSEGVEVAKWLAERGIAAFVLKISDQTNRSRPKSDDSDQGGRRAREQLRVRRR